jgi:ribonuclease HI
MQQDFSSLKLQRDYKLLLQEDLITCPITVDEVPLDTIPKRVMWCLLCKDRSLLSYHNTYADHVYTDGSAIKTKDGIKFAGCGVFWQHMNIAHAYRIRWKGKSTEAELMTNNIAELTAVKVATGLILHLNHNLHQVFIATDSQYTIDAIEHGLDKWVKSRLDNKEHQRLAAHIRHNIASAKLKGINIVLKKVEAHVSRLSEDASGNAAADFLANRGSTGLHMHPVARAIMPRKEDPTPACFCQSCSKKWGEASAKARTKLWYIAKSNSINIHKYLVDNAQNAGLASGGPVLNSHPL